MRFARPLFGRVLFERRFHAAIAGAFERRHGAREVRRTDDEIEIAARAAHGDVAVRDDRQQRAFHRQHVHAFRFEQRHERAELPDEQQGALGALAHQGPQSV
jgi:hypothetical protein